MAPHSSTLAWKIPWMEEPGGLQSMGSQRVGHDWETSLSLFTFHFHALEKEMATHFTVFAWRIPGMREPGGLLSMGSHRVGHDWSDLAAAAAWMRCLCVLHLFTFNCQSCFSGLEKSRSWLWLCLLIWFFPRLHTFRFQSVLRLPVFNLATFSSPAIAITLLCTVSENHHQLVVSHSYTCALII